MRPVSGDLLFQTSQPLSCWDFRVTRTHFVCFPFYVKLTGRRSMEPQPILRHRHESSLE
jgi:hypothetical protein